MLGFFEPSLPLLLLIFLLLCIGAPSSTDAWGREGHKLICKIAENRLLPEATAAVRRVLEGRKLEDLCSWADETEAKRKYPQSGPLHYVQIQGDTCDFCYGRDCGNHQCVVAAILHEEEYLLASYGRVTPECKLNESLLFLAHFMGDIHQPLHVGFARDRGGNTINVLWMPERSKRSLHFIWDTQIIRAALKLYYSNSLDVMVQNIEQSIVDRHVTTLEASGYASESIKEACDYAYTNTTGEFIPSSGSQLNDEYASCRLSLVKRRIAQAGVRLADVLNNIFRRRRNNSGQEIWNGMASLSMDKV